jgi:hypothetical protein
MASLLTVVFLVVKIIFNAFFSNGLRNFIGVFTVDSVTVFALLSDNAIYNYGATWQKGVVSST